MLLITCVELLQFVLEILGDVVDPRFRSGAGGIERPLSPGKVTYPSQQENWPVSKAIPKIESLALCSGEAKFPSDIEQDGILYAAFALTDRGNARIAQINTHKAEVSVVVMLFV